MWKAWFPVIGDSGGALKMAKQGAMGAALFAASSALGAVLLYMGKDPATGGSVSADERLYNAIGAGMESVLILAIAWRMLAGKAWLASVLLLALFVVEISMKVIGGTTNVGWIVAYVALGAMFANGIRGCWWIRAHPDGRVADTSVPVVATIATNPSTNVPYRILENGKKQYTRATFVDVVVSVIFPYFGVLFGVFALVRGERERGMTMAGIGAVVMAVAAFYAVGVS